MDAIIDFVINNYLWILIISLILVFTLIGYLVDITSDKEPKKKKKIKTIGSTEVDNSFAVHPSVEVYNNEKFDDPLIK